MQNQRITATIVCYNNQFVLIDPFTVICELVDPLMNHQTIQFSKSYVRGSPYVEVNIVKLIDRITAI